MSISRRAAHNPAHSHALLLCISSFSGNKIIAAALLRHAQRSARLPCSTPTAVQGRVALKPHACRRISRQSAASRALAAKRTATAARLDSKALSLWETPRMALNQKRDTGIRLKSLGVGSHHSGICSPHLIDKHHTRNVLDTHSLGH